MIQLDLVAKAFGGRPLFERLSWRIQEGERIGLVGPNGIGKTTLCRILAGLEDPDAGRISRDRGLTVGYLPQEVGGATTGSALVEALGGFADVWELEAQLEAIGAALATDPSAELTARYGVLQHRFEARDGYHLEARAKVILGGLGFRPADVHRPLTELSGGWRMRAALARLLLLRPSLLLLDEPTNHLDLEAMEWLEEYLASYAGSVVVVSHDRYFLNRMVTSIAELAPSGLTLYPGNYDAYLVERHARREIQEALARNQARRVAEIERFIERFRYQATKARQVQSRIKMLERLERVSVEREDRRVAFRFPAPPRTGRVVVELAQVDKSYGATVVYRDLNLTIERGDRVALVGVNGAGKSTLLRILAGVLPVEAGTRTLGAHVSVHYYAQHQLDTLDPSRSVREELEAAAPEAPRTQLRTILGTFLFAGDDVEKQVAVLSGGEKARVALAKMLVRPAALLCLDEPTNHLDLASRAVLEQALSTFAGTIVFISHDRYFINALATKVIDIANGVLTIHLGDYDDYLRRTAAAPPTAPAHPGDGGRAHRARAEPRPGASGGAALAALRKQVSAIESEIHALETRLTDLAVALGDPDLYADGARLRAVTGEQRDAQAQMDNLLRRWEELASRVAQHE